MEKEQSKKIIEALLFAGYRPITAVEMSGVLEDVDGKTVRSIIEELSEEYRREGRSFQITEVAGGYQMATDPAYSGYLKKLFAGRKGSKLSQPALETLAIIAYRQPLTRAEVEAVRGVNVDGVVSTLLERGLIRVTGRKDVPGKPLLYGTTREFLEYFGLRSLKDLPEIKEFKEENIAVPIPKQESPAEDRDAQKETE